jgi:ABC-type transporter lipoprotein component MlaA
LGVRIVHTRAGLLQAIETAKESSVDYYLSVQGAYYQYRHGLVTDGAEEDDDLNNHPHIDGTFKGVDSIE